MLRASTFKVQRYLYPLPDTPIRYALELTLLVDVNSNTSDMRRLYVGMRTLRCHSHLALS